MTGRWLRSLTALLSALTISMAAACSLDPTRLPVPGSYVPGSKYTIKIEFSSVLNVPARTKVDSGGVQVGVLDRVQLAGNTAVAYVDISGDVQLPQNTRAELRQATVLGDIYIALLPPERPAPASLRNGDTIPLSNTVPVSNVEDVLRSVSNLLGGGTISTLQQAVVNFNNAFPKDAAEVNQIKTKLGGVLNDLAANQAILDELVTDAENVSNSLVANTGTFDRLVNEGPPKLAGLESVTLNILALIDDAQDLGRSADRLVTPYTPDIIELLSYITPMTESFFNMDMTGPVMGDKLVRLIRDKLNPYFDKFNPWTPHVPGDEPKYIVSEVHPPTATTGVPVPETGSGVGAFQAIDVLRSMGLLP
ncbi:MlaD family protein [Mycobacterium kyorinense]|uniref:Mammalian cell entry protein n=1 Tax=Mycobacterium kyorinense TaxID=487514 RepID=A0A1X1XGN6_9MYCO|nr:MlaD family protein [Mycobacterium kyorinense]ORV97964.1 mammalian cell entry protein [Mycobacterium kyorinense]